MSEGSHHELEAPPKLRIPRPEFTIDSDNDHLELWSFRLPTNVPLGSLNGITIDLKNNMGRFKVDDNEYRIELGESVENESFRVLVPTSGSKEDDDDESMNDSDDEESDQKYLQASSLPFSRHWNVVTAFPQRTERELAPREGPTPVDNVRHAYSHVPQRTGLKRRFMPMGVKAEKSLALIDPMIKDTSSTPSSSAKVKSSVKKENGMRTEKDVSSNVSPSKRIKVETPVVKSEKKAMKAERKSAKKAKKEAKKLKKEKRKSK